MMEDVIEILDDDTTIDASSNNNNNSNSNSNTTSTTIHNTIDHTNVEEDIGLFLVPSEAAEAPSLLDRSQIQELFVSVLNGNNNIHQSEFAFAISQQLKRQWILIRKRDSEPPPQEDAKRGRLKDDHPDDDDGLSLLAEDEFVNQLLTNDFQQVHHCHNNHPTLTQNQSGQDPTSEAQQQKETLLSWFADKIAQLETTLQSTLQEQAQAHQTQLQQLQQKHTQQLQFLRGKFPLDDFDTPRFQKHNQDYQAIQRQIQSAIQTQEYGTLESLHSASQRQYERVQQALQDDIVLLKCRHFNERSSDQTKMMELNTEIKALKDLQQQQIPPRQEEVTVANLANPYASSLVELQCEVTALTKENEQLKAQLNKPTNDSASIPELQNAYNALEKEINNLKQKYQHSEKTNVQLLQQLDAFKKAYNNKCAEATSLTATNAQLQQSYVQCVNENTTLKQQLQQYQSASFEQMGLLQQSTHLNGQTISRAHEIQLLCDQKLQAKEQAHQEELRKIFNDHRGQMKGQRVRMEHLANKIKELDAKGRDKSDTMHEMATELNRIKAQNEVLQDAVNKLQNRAG